MKKIYALALVPVAAIAIAACGAKPTSDLGAYNTTKVTDPDGGVCLARNVNNLGYCPGDKPIATTPEPAPTSASPSPAAPATSPPPQYTLSQQQAIDAAENYLSVEPGWSQAGLIAQLSSPYGNDFSVADATVAVDSLTSVNWNQQAVIKAQDYMTDEPGWSACGLVQQLDSPYGSQFTQAEAEYAVQQVGLGTC
jgi:Host cell surface-exposed lipoprotein